MGLTWLSSLGARIMLDLGMGLILLLDPKRLDQTLLSDLGAGLTLLPDSSILGLCGFDIIAKFMFLGSNKELNGYLKINSFD